MISTRTPRALAFELVSWLPRSWQERCASLLRRSSLLRGAYLQITTSLKNRNGTIAAGPARGLRFNPAESDSRFLLGTFELPIQYILTSQLHSGMVFYDVGAYVGFFAMLAARLVGAQGQVHCFEPLQANVAIIRHNANLNGFNQVFVHPVALAQSDSMASFRVSERPTFGALTDSPISVDKQTGTVQVPVRRLDSFSEEASLSGPSVIKVDIEGSEADFLVGADRIIRHFRPLLVIELHGTNRLVAACLEKLSYDCDIVGGSTIERADWAALAVATPREQPGNRAAVAGVCRQFQGR